MIVTRLKVPTVIISVVMAALPVTGLQAAAPPKMKMTTAIPEGIQTPNKLKTHLGTLTSFDGVPDKKTTQKIL